MTFGVIFFFGIPIPARIEKSFSGDVFAPSGEGFGGTDAPSGAMYGASGYNDICGAAGATSSKKSPSDSACGSLRKESQSLLSSLEIGAPKGGGSSLVLWGVISCSGTGTDLFFSQMRRSWRCRYLPIYYFHSQHPGSSSQTSAKGGGM